MVKNKNGHSNFSMSNRLSPAVEVMMAREMPASIPVYNTLKLLADNYDVCQPTNKAIAEKSHYSTRTIGRALKYMAKKGIIRIIKVDGSRYIILNLYMFFQYITAETSHGIAQMLQFKTPAEICRKDNPAFFNEYNKFMAKNREKRKSSKLNSRQVISLYAKKNHTLPQPHKLTPKEVHFMKLYLEMRVKSLSRSKLYQDVGLYLIKILPLYKDKLVDITNNDISKRLKGKVGKTTVFKAISYLKNAKFLLHMRGKMAISPQLLANAKRSAMAKTNHQRRAVKIARLERKLQLIKKQNKKYKKMQSMQNKKQLTNRD